MKADPADESAPKIFNNGDISYGKEYKDMVFDIIKPIIKQVNEQMAAWENSKAMPFENLSQYRILAEYNSIILAARDNKPAGEANGHGLYYVTWQYDLDRNGVNTGHYTDDYGEAKRNFASRAGLIDEKDLLSKKYDRLHSETFMLPERAENNDRVEKYFTQIHNIDPAIIQGLIKWGKLYESNENHNAIFVAYDGEKNPKSAQEYSTYTPHAVKNPEILSDTTHNFTLLGKPDATKLYVFENPLDSLIQATADKNNGSDWTNAHRMALTVSNNDTSFEGVKRFLEENPQITEVTFWSPTDEKMYKDFINSIDKNTHNIDENDVMSNVNTDVKDMKDIKLDAQNEQSAFENNIAEEENYDGEFEAE